MLPLRAAIIDRGRTAASPRRARLSRNAIGLDWRSSRRSAVAHSQTAAFRRWVRDHMQAPPVVVSGMQLALEVVARMTEARASAAVILGADGRVAGVLTEQDVTRRIAGQGVGAQPVAQVMTRPVATIAADQPLYEAIGFMRRLGLRHMPVVDGGGALAGMLYLHDALAAADPSLV